MKSQGIATNLSLFKEFIGLHNSVQTGLENSVSIKLTYLLILMELNMLESLIWQDLIILVSNLLFSKIYLMLLTSYLMLLMICLLLWLNYCL